MSIRHPCLSQAMALRFLLPPSPLILGPATVRVPFSLPLSLSAQAYLGLALGSLVQFFPGLVRAGRQADRGRQARRQYNESLFDCLLLPVYQFTSTTASSSTTCSEAPPSLSLSLG